MFIVILMLLAQRGMYECYLCMSNNLGLGCSRTPVLR